MHPAAGRRPSSLNRVGPGVMLAFVMACAPLSDRVGDEEVTVGAAERHPSLELLEFRAVALDWVDDLTVAVLDRDDQQIVLLGLADGSQLRGARRGGGPGELEGAFMLRAEDGGAILVGDMRAGRVSRFDRELRFVRSAQVPGIPLLLLDADGDRVTAVWMRFKMTDREPRPEPAVGVLDLATGDARELFSLFDPTTGISRPAEENPFAPPFLSAVWREDGRVVAGQSMEYRIAVLDTSGASLASFGREFEPVFLSDEERAAERERISQAARGARPLPGMGRLMEESLEAPRPYFGPNAFNLDAEGRLWVISERTHGDSTELDLFNSEGVFSQTLALRDRVRALAFRGPRLAALVERMAPEVEGVAGIDVYRVVSGAEQRD